MPAAGSRAAGVKLVTINPGNRERRLPLIGGIYVLFDGETLAPIMTIDGAALTALRTAAVSALVTSRLANPDAQRLVIFGAGVQARAHLETMRAVRAIEEVVFVDGDDARAAALIAEAHRGGLAARAGRPEDVREADIVCTCTTSPSPVFPGALLPAGVHVNAIGAYRRDARELDDDTIGRARIVVEDEQLASTEAGDLVMPLRTGVIDRSAIVADLPALVAGIQARRSPEEITVFKSVGMAWEDLAVAAAAAKLVHPSLPRSSAQAAG